MEKKIDLNNMIKLNNGNIDWKTSAMNKCVIPFVYGDIIGNIIITGYEKEKRKIELQYLDYEPIWMFIDNFKKGNLSKLLRIRTSEFKYNIGDVVINKFSEIKIINRELRPYNKGNWKYYNFHCNKCNYEGDILESHLKNGSGCPVCANRQVLKGYNDIATTDPWMIDLGMSREDAETHMKYSTDIVEITCPNCGKKKKITPQQINNNKSISCICGDGISYPEKFVISMLDQLEINYQHDSYWIENKRYDFYFEYNDSKYVLECHGEQHYRDNTGLRTTLEEQIKNDKYKENLALQNNIIYISLDCRHSNLKWIKNNILNSELNNLFDLTYINWLQCEEFALKNVIKEVCLVYENMKEKNTLVLSKQFNLAQGTIIRYLHKGNKVGWCTYNKRG